LLTEPFDEVEMVLEDPHFFQKFGPPARGFESITGFMGGAVGLYMALQLGPQVSPYSQCILNQIAGHILKVLKLRHGGGTLGCELSVAVPNVSLYFRSRHRCLIRQNGLHQLTTNHGAQTPTKAIVALRQTLRAVRRKTTIRVPDTQLGMRRNDMSLQTKDLEE
jgi:hypothetical protein